MHEIFSYCAKILNMIWILIIRLVDFVYLVSLEIEIYFTLCLKMLVRGNYAR